MRQLAARLSESDLVNRGGWMVIVALLAAGVLLWPVRPELPRSGVVYGGRPHPGGRPAHRTGANTPPPGRRVRARRRSRPGVSPVPVGAPITAAAAIGITTSALLGMFPGLAAAVAVFTAGRLVRGAVRARRSRIELAQVTAGLRLMSRELRSGAPVPQACVLAGAAASGVAAELLEKLAREVRFGVGGPTDGPASDGDLAETVTMGRRLRAALRLSARRGIPLADLVETFAADVEARAALADRRSAEVAGPQLSGYLLAALPAVGLLLGAAMGAAPVTVLLHTGLGQLLLVVGVSLSCLGLAWISRIVRA